MTVDELLNKLLGFPTGLAGLAVLIVNGSIFSLRKPRAGVSSPAGLLLVPTGRGYILVVPFQVALVADIVSLVCPAHCYRFSCKMSVYTGGLCTMQDKHVIYDAEGGSLRIYGL